jgi:TPR repeat protein
MTDRRFRHWPLAALVCGLALSACGTAEEPAPDEETVLLEAEFFQERWQDGGATLLIRAVDGRFAWQNRVMLTAGRHLAFFQYDVTTACAAEKGCAVRRYTDRIEFDAMAERTYRLRAMRENGAVRSWIEDRESGKTVADSVTAEVRVEYEGYPNEAWEGLCKDAERGDAMARRAIGLHYWRGWWPAERNVVLAYLWLSLAMQANDSAAAIFRARLGDEMNGEEIVEAERRLRRWKPGRCAVGADRATPADLQPKPAADKAAGPKPAAPATAQPSPRQSAPADPKAADAKVSDAATMDRQHP